MQWLIQRGKQGCIGETGAFSQDGRWNTCLDLGLAYLQANNTAVYYFASGLTGLGLSIDKETQGLPVQGRQVAVLTKYTGAAQPTTYALSGPANHQGTVGQPSTFTIEYDGLITSAQTYTPTDFGKGGSFNPSALTLFPGFNGTATITYTPAVADTLLIGATNAQGFTDPSAWVLGTETDLFRVNGLTPQNVFSFHKRVTTYNGPCRRLRRSRDNATQDFGFVGTKIGSYLDTASIAAWAGSDTLHSVIRYDQSLNGWHDGAVDTDNNVGGPTQADEPLFLVDAGDGLPAEHYLNSRSQFMSPINGNAAQTILSVHKWVSGSNVLSWSFLSSDSWGSPTWTVNINGGASQSVSTGVVANQWHAYADRFRGATANTGFKAWVDGQASGAGTTTSIALVQEYNRNTVQVGWYRFGTAGNPQSAEFYARDLIVLKDASDAAVAAITAAQMTDYGIAAPYVYNPSYPPDTTSAPAFPIVGANLSGMEDSSGIHPPAQYPYGKSYAAYYYSKGFNCARLPFKRARIQTIPGGALGGVTIGGVDGLAALDMAVADVTQSGLTAIIDMHDYADELANGTLTQAQFADVWGKLGARYRSNPKVVADLQNEPHSVSSAVMGQYAQAAITSLRNAGFNNWIMVEGGGSYAAANAYVASGAASAFEALTDPLNKLIAQVHCYLDANGQGSSPTPSGTGVGVLSLIGCTERARSAGTKLFLGEFGISTDASMIAEVAAQLDYISNNRDVWVGWTAWTTAPYQLLPSAVAAAPYQYPPPAANGLVVDQPQMSTLTAHGVASAYNTAPSGVLVNWTPGMDGGFVPTSTPVGTQIATLSAIDANIGGNTWTFTKVADPDGVATLTGNALVLAAALVNGSSHPFTLRATDDKGAHGDTTVSVLCNNITTLNPGALGANLSLSNGNLTVTHDNTNGTRAVRATKSRSAGKVHFEVTFTPPSGNYDVAVGLSRAEDPVNGPAFGGFNNQGAFDIIIYAAGPVVAQNAGILAGDAFMSGQRVAVEVDFTAKLLWFAVGSGNWNKSASANPGTGTGGISFAQIAAAGQSYPVPVPLFPTIFIYGANEAADAYFDPATFTRAVSSGFNAL